MSPLHATLPDLDSPAVPLERLLAPIEAAGLLAAPVSAEGVAITGVTDDSRATRPGTLFGALAPDTAAGRHGHTFVADAIAAGASAVLVGPGFDTDSVPTGAVTLAGTPIPLGKGEGTGNGPRLPSAVLVSTTDTRAALAEAAAVFYGDPARRLTLVGITGTNGKTTTAFLLHHLLTTLGRRAGLVGTVENRIGSDRYATQFTTPEAPALQRLLAAMVAAGCTHAAMEVSSHGLALDRVRGVPFAVGVFTNLTHDHLDFHGSADAYEAAKKRLFDGLDATATAVVNADDPAWRRMTNGTEARVVTFGTSADADVRVEVLDNSVGGLHLRLDGRERRFRLAGRFNALNLAAAYAVGVALGFDAGDVLDALAEAPGVPGRFETVRSADGVLGVVDYAHTPDALANVLATAREIVAPGGSLWSVFGCGGDRDRSKRPEMAREAETRADRVVLTSDNPRSEDPEAILDDVAGGLAHPDRVLRLVDRAEAIARAASEARPGDVVVVAGKGHETYQIVGAERRDFDDRAVLRDAFAARAEVAA